MAAKKCPTGQILAAIFCPRTKIGYDKKIAVTDLWVCPTCSPKEYGQLIKALVNTVETLMAEVASLKKLVKFQFLPTS